MKAIVFGATGLVGSELLNACIAHDKITKVFVVSRRELGDDRQNNAKVEFILHEDFSEYPPELIAKLRGSELCFWAIGGLARKFKNKKLAYDANVVFPTAAARALLKHLPKDSPSGKIRFVFCSGQYTEQDPNQTLYFLPDSRKMKGETETNLQKLAEANPAQFETWAVRPGLIVPRQPPFGTRLMTYMVTAISAEHVAKVMVKIAIDGWKDRVLEQDVMLQIK